jgi:hypothetical protein
MIGNRARLEDGSGKDVNGTPYYDLRPARSGISLRAAWTSQPELRMECDRRSRPAHSHARRIVPAGASVDSKPSIVSIQIVRADQNRDKAATPSLSVIAEAGSPPLPAPPSRPTTHPLRRDAAVPHLLPSVTSDTQAQTAPSEQHRSPATDSGVRSGVVAV